MQNLWLLLFLYLIPYHTDVKKGEVLLNSNILCMQYDNTICYCKMVMVIGIGKLKKLKGIAILVTGCEGP
jgi:hypothetical protein